MAREFRIFDSVYESLIDLVEAQAAPLKLEKPCPGAARRRRVGVASHARRRAGSKYFEFSQKGKAAGYLSDMLTESQDAIVREMKLPK